MIQRVEQVRSWASHWEPLFRLAEIVIVIIFGTILTSVVSCQEIKVANKELAVSELQLKLSLAEVAPRIEFSDAVSMAPKPEDSWAKLQAICRRTDITLVGGKAVLFVEHTTEKGTVVRVAIPDFFHKESLGKGFIDFESSEEADFVAKVKFWHTKDFVTTKDFNNIITRKDRVVRCCIRIDYTNAIGESVHEWFLVAYPGTIPSSYPRSVDIEPEYDQYVNLQNHTKDGRCDFAAVNQAVESAIGVGRLVNAFQERND